MKIKYLIISLSLIQCSNLICAEHKSDESQEYEKLIEMEEGKRKETASQTEDVRSNINTTNYLNFHPETQAFLKNLVREYAKTNNIEKKNILDIKLGYYFITFVLLNALLFKMIFH